MISDTRARDLAQQLIKRLRELAGDKADQVAALGVLIEECEIEMVAIRDGDDE